MVSLLEEFTQRQTELKQLNNLLHQQQLRRTILDAYQHQPQNDNEEPRTRLSSSNSSDNITKQLVTALMKQQNQVKDGGVCEDTQELNYLAEVPDAVSAPSEISKNIDKTISVSSREKIK